jgi:hypothetical protein
MKEREKTFRFPLSAYEVTKARNKWNYGIYIIFIAHHASALDT